MTLPIYLLLLGMGLAACSKNVSIYEAKKCPQTQFPEAEAMIREAKLDLKYGRILNGYAATLLNHEVWADDKWAPKLSLAYIYDVHDRGKITSCPKAITLKVSFPPSTHYKEHLDRFLGYIGRFSGQNVSEAEKKLNCVVAQKCGKYALLPLGAKHVIEATQMFDPQRGDILELGYYEKAFHQWYFSPSLK